MPPRLPTAAGSRPVSWLALALLAACDAEVGPARALASEARLGFVSAIASSSAVSSEPRVAPEVVFPPPAEEPPVTPEFPLDSPRALEPFYEKLTLIDLGIPVLARAGHFGDSIIAADRMTTKIRGRFQQRFGDGGPGFHALARYNAGYQHLDVTFQSGGWDSCLIIFKCRSDGRYGYGGVVSKDGGGATSVFLAPSDASMPGISRFEFWYEAHPKGGRFSVQVDEGEPLFVETRSEETKEAWLPLELPEGRHVFKIRAEGHGSSRGYGVVMERQGPGLVWDEVAIIGAFTQRLDHHDPDHLRGQLARRQLDLMVFLLGGNDTLRNRTDLHRSRPMTPYENEFRAVIRKFRGARPEAGCLVMSVTDHGDPIAPGLGRRRHVVPRIASVQREVARQEGCAFFDTFALMDRDGGIEAWAQRHPAWANGDLAHLAEPGHEAVSRALYEAVLAGYFDYRKRMTGKPFPALKLALAAGEPRREASSE